MSAGQKIIDGLKDAVAGNFARVHIPDEAGNLQTWIREDSRDAPDQAIIDKLQASAEEWQKAHVVVTRAQHEALIAATKLLTKHRAILFGTLMNEDCQELISAIEALRAAGFRE